MGHNRRIMFFEPLENRVLLSRSCFVPPGGQDTCAGTMGAPLASIQRAATLAQPGDTVLIRGGTYRETVTPTNSGTAGAPITFRFAEDAYPPMTGEFQEVRPPHRLAFTWGATGTTSIAGVSDALSQAVAGAAGLAPALVLSDRMQQQYTRMICDLVEGVFTVTNPEPKPGFVRLAVRAASRHGVRLRELAADGLLGARVFR